ncbi:Dps family protein [Synechococcus elongatus]|uniref:Dps family protein n=1 Tax=Synechococcus elongatus TaxID=32046 RepID=UPI000F7E392C|nr:ferritin-like domain-containing protein [Synechococcus elongatus]
MALDPTILKMLQQSGVSTDWPAPEEPQPLAVKPSRMDLAPRSRAIVADELNKLSITLIDLRLKARQAHWNIRGKDFYQLHQLFDDIQGFLDEFSDRLAERIAGLGGYATACVHCIAKHSPLEAMRETHQDSELVVAIANGLALLSSQSRHVSSICDCDVVTENIVCDLAEGADKYLWQLEATNE